MSDEAEPPTDPESAASASKGPRSSNFGRDEPGPDALRQGRRWATIVFLVVVATFTLLQSGQIAQQSLFPKPVTPHGDCAQNLSELVGALDRARSAAEHDLDPDVALSRFRAALDPEWSLLEGARASCVTAVELRSLDALERLRYAEEHAVRREAASLATLRRQVAADVAKRTSAVLDKQMLEKQMLEKQTLETKGSNAEGSTHGPQSGTDRR